MYSDLNTNVSAKGLHIGIAVSRYHRAITDSLRQAAIDAFLGAGGEEQNLLIVSAAGTFELTVLCRAMAELETRTGRSAVDAAVALGCVITGETTHDQFIAQSVTQGLTLIAAQTGMPIAFGVLTCQSIEQATARSLTAAPSGGVNKGAEAMIAAIETANTIKALRSPRMFR